MVLLSFRHGAPVSRAAAIAPRGLAEPPPIHPFNVLCSSTGGARSLTAAPRLPIGAPQIWYTLTPSFLEVMSESGCFGTEKFSIDISSIIDVTYESKGCGGCCCYSVIEIFLPGGESNHTMRVSNRKAAGVYEAIKNCWEAFQANRANRTQRL